MANPEPKHTVEEIRTLFNAEVDRFSDETTGQTSAVDAALVLDMIEETVARMHEQAETLCDIGCGGGNFSVRLSRRLPQLRVTLIDLSEAMLERASARLKAENRHVEQVMQGDIREISLPPDTFDVVVAGAVLHHLRTREQWHDVFANIHRGLKSGGAFWYWDLIRHENEDVQAVQSRRFAEYLIERNGREQQERTFVMIEKSDTPETPLFLMQTMLETGFVNIDIVHKNTNFIAMVARKA